MGEKATKWESSESQEVDGLTTNGVLIMHPKAVFCPGPDYRGEVAKPGIWREVSVGGKVFGLRESRSAATQVRSLFMGEREDKSCNLLWPSGTFCRKRGEHAGRRNPHRPLRRHPAMEIRRRYGQLSQISKMRD